ncbi:MAG: Gfo/Idh/MocA family oxidoreductase [Spirochaetes bacterium]|nr:Gfo/Idh/MocA family oxidoreductase [Spirochaetota bacterium]
MQNIGIVGLGKISQKHITAIQQVKGLTIYAVCDKNKKQLKRATLPNNIVTYHDYQDLLNDNKVHIVDICTPSGLHPDMVIRAANKKKNIIVEKPLALYTRNGIMAIEAAKKNKVKLFVVRQNRYNLPVMALKKAIRQKRFGKIFYAKTSVYWHRDQGYYSSAKWRGTRDMDGGVLMNQASHHIDLLQWLIGSVASVSAKARTVLHKIEAEDLAVVLMEFSNKAYGIIEATTCANPNNLEGTLMVMGSKGTVILGGYTGEKIKLWDFKEKRKEDEMIIKKYSENPKIFAYPHIEYFKNVKQVLDHKSKPISDGLEELKTTRLIEAIYQSIEKKKVIFL